MEWRKIGKAASGWGPGWTCAAVFLIGWGVFLIGIGTPPVAYWDEGNYVPAVRDFLSGVIANREHPPLAKELMSLGYLAFGDTPLGWRFMTSMFGALSLVGVYLWSLALFRGTRPALLAVLFTLVNQVLYVQSRTANLDTFMLAFMLWGLAAFTASWHAETPARGRALMMLAGACLGLSTACKWIGVVPWIICVGVIIVVRQFQLWRVRFEEPGERDWYGPDLWKGIRPRDFLIAFGAIPLGLYYLTFLPTYGLIAPGEFLAMHASTFDAMSTTMQAPVLLSHWTTWPFARHPNYFVIDPWVAKPSGYVSAAVVVFLGNPVVLFLGLPAVAACAYGWIRHRRFDAMLITTFYLGLYLCWAVIPRASTTYTYYFQAATILGVALAYAVTQTPLARRSWVCWGVVSASVLAFALFLPITSAAVGTTPWIYDHLMWFESWRWPRPGF